eukprot:COSAG05_NODE_1139_length_5741_cov_7.808401_1_plen_306_part_00
MEDPNQQAGAAIPSSPRHGGGGGESAYARQLNSDSHQSEWRSASGRGSSVGGVAFGATSGGRSFASSSMPTRGGRVTPRGISQWQSRPARLDWAPAAVHARELAVSTARQRRLPPSQDGHARAVVTSRDHHAASAAAVHDGPLPTLPPVQHKGAVAAAGPVTPRSTTAAPTPPAPRELMRPLKPPGVDLVGASGAPRAEPAAAATDPVAQRGRRRPGSTGRRVREAVHSQHSGSSGVGLATRGSSRRSQISMIPRRAAVRGKALVQRRTITPQFTPGTPPAGKREREVLPWTMEDRFKVGSTFAH